MGTVASDRMVMMERGEADDEFACVFGSVTSAVLGMVSTLRWSRQFAEQADSAGTIYSFVEGSGARIFEDFKQQRATEPAEQILAAALRELWRIGQLHRDRYRWLRSSELGDLSGICRHALPFIVFLFGSARVRHLPLD